MNPTQLNSFEQEHEDDFAFDIGGAPSFSSRNEGDVPPPRFLDSLNPEQREAALTTEGPLIVLAGAGSGKTKMLTSRIAYLISAKGVAPYHILAVTFTNKAAQEMQERVDRVLSEMDVHAFGRAEIGTFHSVCVRILRRELDRLPFTKPFVIYDDSDQLSLIKSVLNQLNIDSKNFNPKSLRGTINLAKCDAIGPEDVKADDFTPYARVFRQVYDKYQKELIANNALDFGEIICMTYRLLRDHPDIRQKYQRQYRYIHVDEYQDTNRAQYLLLSTLASPEFGGHQNICVVGDEDQSIYKWRGADIRNILDFEKDYGDAKVIKLEQNYRSTQTIVDASSYLIRHNLRRKDKTLWTQNEPGAPILQVKLPDERMEAEFVVSEIQRLARDEGMSFKDFAIFYRTHAQSRQFEDLFRREKISYRIIGGTRFYDRKEIKDLLSYFRVALNPDDSVSMKRIVNVPARGIGKTTMDKLDQVASENLWQTLQDIADGKSDIAGRAGTKIAGFVKLMRKFTVEHKRLLLSDFFHMILDDTGYVQELKAEDTVESLARIENLEELDNVIRDFEEEMLKGVEEKDYPAARAALLPQFLERTMLDSEVNDESVELNSAEPVKMMSLHGAKGLEFPVVFMVGLEEGLFPSIRQWEETPAEEIEEERRLCYVGMTRAREKLYISHVDVRRLWGNIQYQEPARFLGELPDHLVKIRDLTARAKTKSSSFISTGGSTGSGSSPSKAAPFSGGYVPRTVPEPPPPKRPIDGSWVGRQLDHPEYGWGVILSEEGTENDRKVVVEFEGKVKRKFLAKYVASYIE